MINKSFLTTVYKKNIAKPPNDLPSNVFRSLHGQHKYKFYVYNTQQIFVS